MDRGSEFMGEVQLVLCQEYGAQARLITARNPQANSMVERAHQMIKNMIRSAVQ
jgi:transposase InsO family protein